MENESTLQFCRRTSKEEGEMSTATNDRYSVLTFKVNKSIILYGVEISTQKRENVEKYADSMYVCVKSVHEIDKPINNASDTIDVESCGYQNRHFGESVKLDADVVYVIQVDVYTSGVYPLLETLPNEIIRVDDVNFQFQIDEKHDKKPGFIRSLIFKRN